MLVYNSCTEAIIGDSFDQNSSIILKWFPSYPDDTFEKNKIALEWCLSYLGANIAGQPQQSGIIINSNTNTMIIDIQQLGFTEKAQIELKKLHQIFKESEEYKFHEAFDIGKYIALTLGSSYHYYKIVDIPEHIDFYTTNSMFNELKGYVDKSSVALPNFHRIISYTKLNNNEQVFLSEEINPTSQEVKEFETLERMSNGQLKYAIYDADGFLTPNADATTTRAGKPAKCLWCHEVGIQPLFSEQNDFNGFLSNKQLKDTLNFYNFRLSNYQDDLWINPDIQNKRLHTNMELSYISYMEPSAERLAIEWNISIYEVETLLNSVDTHRHEEFDFLGNLYYRNEIDALAPFVTIQPPGSIREASIYEPNLLND